MVLADKHSLVALSGHTFPVRAIVSVRDWPQAVGA